MASLQLAAELTVRLAQNALAKSGVGVIVLKGPHIANVLYDDPLDRPYGDLDLLVRPSEFARSIRVLEGCRFVRPPEPSGRPATMRAYYCTHLDSPFGIGVELHQSFSGHDRYPVDVGGLFDRAAPFEMGRVKALGLGTEDLLLHLCIHMGKSYFAVETKHISDIHLVVTKRRVDWDLFLRLARAAGCRVAAYYALRAAVVQRSTPVPRAVLEALAPSNFRSAWVERFVHSDEYPISWPLRTSTVFDQVFVGLPLVDEVWRWPGIALGYAVLRLKDATGALFA